jgi:hypothetical protein
VPVKNPLIIPGSDVGLVVCKTCKTQMSGHSVFPWFSVEELKNFTSMITFDIKILILIYKHFYLFIYYKQFIALYVI